MGKKTILLVLVLLLIPFTLGLDTNWEGELPNYISEYLDTNGNQTGTLNAIGDYSSGQKFYIQPPSDKVYRLARLIITISDTGITDADEYGALTELTNGISFWIELNGIKTRVDGNRNTSVTNIGEYTKLMHDFNCCLSSLANGKDYCTGRWTFEKSGTLFRLDGATNDKFIVQLNDSFIGLDQHYFLVQGYEEKAQNTTSEVINMLGISFILMFVLGLYLVLAINWDFVLFDVEGKTDNKNNIIKSALVWLLVWLIPLIVQFSIELGGTYGASADILTLLETLYTTTIWIGYTITVYFMIYFGYNILLFITNVTNKK